MNHIPKSSHASHRQKNRSIPDEVVNLVLQYGRTIRRQGADVYLLGRKERRRLVKNIEIDMLKKIEHKLKAYVVLGDNGSAITCGYRTRRLHAN